MSDTRFTILGIVLIFAGFLVFGVLGGQYRESYIQAEEFGDCYEYSDDASPARADCSAKVFDQSAFFAIIISVIGAGVVMLIKGVRGKWDSEVRPEDIVGPGNGFRKDNSGD